VAAETDKTLKFKIDGVDYDVPPISDLDMDEWEVIYARTGLILDDFTSRTPVVSVMRGEVARLEDEAARLAEGSDERRRVDDDLAEAVSVLAEAEAALTDDERQAERDRKRKLSQPGFTRALVQIAYQRKHPDEKRDVAEKFASKAKLVPLTVDLFEQAMEDEVPVPLASTPELEQSLPNESGANSETGSTGSTPLSDESASLREPTGTAV
jgi:hypothetical protein